MKISASPASSAMWRCARSAALPATRTRCSHANRRKVNKPPFRPRRAGATAETAAACLHFRRTSRNHDINVIRNASGDSSAAVRRRAMNAIELERRYSAHNYAPLPVVLTRGKGAHLWDTAGRRYVDMMSAYSAASHGHGHPRILAALTAQAERLAVPSRAYYNDRLGAFLEELCTLTSLDAALPMNTGAEAVETAIKAARRWGYRVKGIARDHAEIIVASGNFHGRTTTVISASTEPDYRDGFGPGSHGSTFGGNPLAAAVGLEALHVIRDEGLVEKSRVLGAHMLERLRAIASPALKDVRGRGLWVGAEIDPAVAGAREACERLLAKGVLSKETHQTVVRLAPPLVIARADLDWALDRFEEVLRELDGTRRTRAA